MVVGLHSVVLTFDCGLLYLSGLPRVHNEVPDTAGGYHYLTRRGSSPVFGLYEPLPDYPSKGAGEHGSYLPTLVGRKQVDYTVDCLSHINRVQGGEDQVAGLRCGESDLGALRSSNLADEYYVGVLS